MVQCSLTDLPSPCHETRNSFCCVRTSSSGSPQTHILSRLCTIYFLLKYIPYSFKGSDACRWYFDACRAISIRGNFVTVLCTSSPSHKAVTTYMTIICEPAWPSVKALAGEQKDPLPTPPVRYSLPLPTPPVRYSLPLPTPPVRYSLPLPTPPVRYSLPLHPPPVSYSLPLPTPSVK